MTIGELVEKLEKISDLKSEIANLERELRNNYFKPDAVKWRKDAIAQCHQEILVIEAEEIK